ncbi:hypothetical protein Dform_01503 [Dehalogenimonas formicexedens]|uniref:Uncharacterized protein n=1 Tax=Dehalogenimonas formicexedens TaxID=1839801 RepID=A0A1P8F8Q2_9CHLR|nr:hypothetical protein [Dehalogenimonas formicexedens]APV44825.1 hypothetical protein Dform_01503 [Dehalogenimonas formicexedens]
MGQSSSTIDAISKQLNKAFGTTPTIVDIEGIDGSEENYREAIDLFNARGLRVLPMVTLGGKVVSHSTEVPDKITKSVETAMANEQ